MATLALVRDKAFVGGAGINGSVKVVQARADTMLHPCRSGRGLLTLKPHRMPALLLHPIEKKKKSKLLEWQRLLNWIKKKRQFQHSSNSWGSGEGQDKALISWRRALFMGEASEIFLEERSMSLISQFHIVDGLVNAK